MSLDDKIKNDVNTSQTDFLINSDIKSVTQHVRTAKLDDLLFFLGHPDEEVRSIVWWRLTYSNGEIK